MSYATTSDMKNDLELRARLVACAAIERESRSARQPGHEMWVEGHIWQIVAHADWDAAYGYAVNTGVDNPGRREDVITDAMILSSIQPIVISEAGG